MAEEAVQEEMELDANEGATPAPPEEAPEQPEEQKSEGDKQEPVEAPFDWSAFKESLKDDKLKKHADRFTDPAGLLKGHYELRQKLSKAIVPPGKDASDEEIQDYRKAIGVPEEPTGYEFEGVNEEDESQKEILNGWREVFHKNNIPKETAKAIHEAGLEMAQKAVEAQKEQDAQYVKEAEDTLRKEWGNEYEANKKYAERAAAELFGDDYEDVKKLEDKTGRYILDNPPFLRLLATVGREMGEGRLGSVLSEDQATSIKEKADEARAKASEAWEKGNYKEANEWSEKERQLLGKLP